MIQLYKKVNKISSFLFSNIINIVNINKGNYYIRVFHKYPDKMNKEVKKKLEEIKEICK